MSSFTGIQNKTMKQMRRGVNKLTVEETKLIRDENRRMREENKQMRERELCRICRDEIANVVVVNCGHIAYCRACSRIQLVRCHVCNKTITGNLFEVYRA